MIPLQFALRRRMMLNKRKLVVTVRLTGVTMYPQGDITYNGVSYIDSQQFEVNKGDTVVITVYKRWGMQDATIYLNNELVTYTSDYSTPATYRLAVTKDCTIRLDTDGTTGNIGSSHAYITM